METKFLEILHKCCNSMDHFDRLGSRARDLVVQWQSRCGVVMQGIEEGFENQKVLEKAYELMGSILIYHVDAWAEGKLFCHPSLPSKPREEIWAPIDEGDGDGDIYNPDVAAPLPRAPLRPRHVTYTKARGGQKRGSIQVEDKDGKRPRRECTGLRGGGVGGLAEVPPWFLEWRQDVDNEKLLNRLITTAKKELGLTFVDAPVLHLKQTFEKKIQSLELKNAGSQRSDVEDIRGGGFITDGVITQYFEGLTPILHNQVNLVPPASSLAFAHDPYAMDVALLASSEINILPVNNSTSDEPDMGSHWSVMVLYRPINGAPRLVHHDSTEGRINNEAAERLARSIRRVLPPFQESVVEHASTPLQDNNADCAVFVMAIANSIGRWRLSKGHQGQQLQQDWVNTLARDIDQNVVAQMRNLLPEFLEGQMTVEELNSVCFFSGDGVDGQGKNGLP
ncbi:uncharacterized protein [Triticum aestivum]|uniref:uncharacterized protein n=1 Tax=Triticum aestivum TaxID=4565 RepID=UPI001D005FD7|nr:uncharacterized protein LOC123062877 [Triticum aestivum]